MQFVLKYNPEKTGLRTLFREWHLITMKVLWETPETRLNTKSVWTKVNDRLEDKVSRATVYHFLDDMVKKGVLYSDTKTGRGGKQMLFYSEVTEAEFKRLICKNLVQSVQQNLGDCS